MFLISLLSQTQFKWSNATQLIFILSIAKVISYCWQCPSDITSGHVSQLLVSYFISFQSAESEAEVSRLGPVPRGMMPVNIFSKYRGKLQIGALNSSQQTLPLNWYLQYFLDKRLSYPCLLSMKKCKHTQRCKNVSSSNHSWIFLPWILTNMILSK